MIKLLDLIKEILQEGNNPYGKVVYHGSSFKLDLNSLDIDRKSLARNLDGTIIKETGSERDGVGFYVSLDLWLNNPGDFYDRVLNPVHKEGTKGNESAQKYAGNDVPGYIYQVDLSDDINLEEYGYNGVDGKNVRKGQKDKLLAEGIDGLYEGKIEAVILNKEKIKSLKLVYKAEKLMKQIIPLKTDGIEYWSHFHNKENRRKALDVANWVCVKEINLDSYLKQELGDYFKFYNDKEVQVYTNAPKEVDDFPSKYNIEDYKFLKVYSDFPDWEKV
jgi:hypothetical protein